MSLILYGSEMWNSPYVLSCFVALREKGLPFESRLVALHSGAQHDTVYTALSLTSRVPTLLDGDFSLSESSAIVEYLEDKFSAPTYPRLLPVDLRERARARQVMAWVRSDLGALREERSSEYVFFDHQGLPALASLTDAGKRAAEKVVRVADRLLPAGGGRLFQSWCIADTDLAMMLWRLSRTGYELPAKLRAFADAEWARPAVREFVDQPRPPRHFSSV
jgi:glutathione S-transferase